MYSHNILPFVFHPPVLAISVLPISLDRAASKGSSPQPTLNIETCINDLRIRFDSPESYSLEISMSLPSSLLNFDSAWPDI